MENIKNPLPLPNKCDHCGCSSVSLLKNEVKTKKGTYLNSWKCNRCHSRVSCHPGTNIPMGHMTDTRGRMMRKFLHNIFDELWQKQYMSRDEAYEWLAIELLIKRENCHISRLTKEQLQIAINICSDEIKKRATILSRRHEKSKAKRITQHEQHRKHVERKRNEGYIPFRKRRETSHS